MSHQLSRRVDPRVTAAIVAAALGGCASEAPQKTCPVPNDVLISDFEDGRNGVKKIEGRNGGWYVFNDMTGKQTPVEGQVSGTPDGACESQFALKTTGSGFSGWGAGIGTDVATDASNKKTTYDASQYQGVRFFARSGKGPLPVRLNLQDSNTTPEGGVCTKCDDNYGSDFMLTEEWREYKAPFSAMAQLAWGDPFPALLTAKLYGIQFKTAAPEFELWVDEIAFF